MRHSLSLRRPALLLALLATLALPQPARAHRLEAEYKVLPGGKVRVESWFETGDSPKGALVTVSRADGTLLFPKSGVLDAKGIYIFSYPKTEDLQILISAGEGHSKKLVIPAEKLTEPGASETSTERPEAEPVPERRYEPPILQLLLGVGLLLALAVLVPMLRRRLRTARVAEKIPTPAPRPDGKTSF
jgi:hypothetical protein